MPVRKIINSFRYNVYLIVLACLIGAGALVVAVENQMLASGAKDIFRLDRQVKELRSKKQAQQRSWQEEQSRLAKMAQSAHASETIEQPKPAVDFEGIYQDGETIFALVNGQMLKAGDRTGNFELRTISLEKVVFVNTQTQEEVAFDLLKDVKDMKGIKIN